jgi:hypothetical protein
MEDRLSKTETLWNTKSRFGICFVGIELATYSSETSSPHRWLLVSKYTGSLRRL